MNLEELLGKDLAGYTIVQWLEVQGSTNEFGNCTPRGYYTDRALADVKAKSAGWYGGKGQVEQIFVLVKRGEKQGFALSGLKPGTSIQLVDEQTKKLEAARKALAKLDPEERRLLGFDSKDAPDAQASEE